MAERTTGVQSITPIGNGISNTPYTMTPNQATQIVNSVGINPSDVLSSGNVAQTITAPAPAPDDLLGIRAAIMNELGVNTAQTAYDTAVGAVNSATANLNTNLQQLSNRPVSMSKITGQSAQLREVAGNEIQALADSANLALQTLNAKKAEAETQFGIRESEIGKIQTLQANFAGAGIKVSDSYDKAISKIEKYTEKQEKKALKSALKETARGLGIDTSGKSTKALEKAIAKANKEALDMTKQKFDLDMEATRAQIAKLKSGGSGTEDAGNLEEIGIDAEGNTLFRNSKTGVVTTDKKLGEGAGINMTPKAAEPGYWEQFSITSPSTWFNF